MSLYNMLFGQAPLAPALLKILDIETCDIPRYRDCCLGNDGKSIIIYTRTGGGNRDYYASEEECRSNYPEYFTEDNDSPPSGPWNSDLQAHPMYASDYDDDFDHTYAYFEFKVPEEWADELRTLAAQGPGATTTPSEKWQALFASLKSDNPTT
jgi:hypothetical protein